MRDEGALESALARPQATFEGVDLYPTLAEKAAALFHSLVANDPFVDGNNRVAAISMELFVMVNGFEVVVSNEEREVLTMTAARGERKAEEISIWIEQRLDVLR